MDRVTSEWVFTTYDEWDRMNRSISVYSLHAGDCHAGLMSSEG